MWNYTLSSACLIALNDGTFTSSFGRSSNKCLIEHKVIMFGSAAFYFIVWILFNYSWSKMDLRLLSRVHNSSFPLLLMHWGHHIVIAQQWFRKLLYASTGIFTNSEKEGVFFNNPNCIMFAHTYAYDGIDVTKVSFLCSSKWKVYR